MKLLFLRFIKFTQNQRKRRTTKCPFDWIMYSKNNLSVREDSISVILKKVSKAGSVVTLDFICLTSLLCVFSNASSDCLPDMRHSHMRYIYWTFLHCAFSNVTSEHLPKKMHSHTGCICLFFLHCDFSNVPSNCLPQ